MLIKYDKLPNNLKNKEVKEYYDILSKKRVYLFIKRLFDIIASFILLVLLSPVFLVLAIIIKLDSKGPVFYRQERITKYGKVFRIFKFRTMIVDADKKGSLVTKNNDDRITKIGKKIRNSRLDEIPQLINVLMGDMSFVGTRPEVAKYVDKYTNKMLATLLMPAGITSQASINFRDESAIMDKYINKKMDVDEVYIKEILPKKMSYNLEYLRKCSIIEDIKLCIKTVL